MSDHPLDKEFEVETKVFMDDYETVNIPEGVDERDLDLIIDLALKQYKMNMDDMALVEPKNRLRLQEINRDLLAQTKDAIHKKERLKIEREKMEKARRMPQPSSGAGEGEEEGKGDADAGVNRNDLYGEVTRLRKVK